MSLDIANSNVNRNVALSGTSIAIFTFLLFFLYPRYSSGEINPILFQLSLAIIVTAVFALVISALFQYGTVLTLTPKQERLPILGKAEGLWFVGYSLLLLEPGVILITVNLLPVGFYALLLWVSSMILTMIEGRKQAKKRVKV